MVKLRSEWLGFCAGAASDNSETTGETRCPQPDRHSAPPATHGETLPHVKRRSASQLAG